MLVYTHEKNTRARKFRTSKFPICSLVEQTSSKLSVEIANGKLFKYIITLPHHSVI